MSSLVEGEYKPSFWDKLLDSIATIIVYVTFVVPIGFGIWVVIGSPLARWFIVAMAVSALIVWAFGRTTR